MEKHNNNSLAEFDWTPFEDGWNGKTLRVNHSIKTGDRKTKVYSHEIYAQELFGKYTHSMDATKVHHKDLIIGSTLEVTNVRPIGKTTVMVDTVGGGSCVVDMNKEREYIRQFGCEDPEKFVASLGSVEQQEAYITTHPAIKVVSKDRVSLWDGYLVTVEAELFKSMTDQDSAYYAKIIGTNRGGFICVVNGINCFLPGSMASAGVVTDFDAMIGKTLPVMVINYVKGMGFVVSYKQYLSKILPKKIQDELSYNMRVACRVTGTSKNGIFVSFNDNEGEPIFTGLIYRDYMSNHLEELFDKKKIVVGDEFPAHILRIDNVNGETRINLSDIDVESDEFKNKQARLKQQREEAKETRAPQKADAHTKEVEKTVG